MAINDPRERDLWLESESRIERDRQPAHFAARQIVVLALLILVPVLVYLVVRFT